MSIADLRREYALARLDEANVSADPIVQFDRWFAEAREAKVAEPNAMALATATREGAPSVRMVLLKGADQRGFAFFTDYRSQKGVELGANPRAALVFYWPDLERQVRITGRVSVVPREESESYFRTRPRESRLSAWASHQSQVVPDRKTLDDRGREMDANYPTENVPLPPYWGGYRLAPEMIEFWQGRANRLHDRLRYTRDGGGWRLERLSP
jgi:pyridoxamine 5'-phosphate oxidase